MAVLRRKSFEGSTWGWRRLGRDRAEVRASVVVAAGRGAVTILAAIGKTPLCACSAVVSIVCICPPAQFYVVENASELSSYVRNETQ